jgi:hypothetical protein
MSCLVEHCDRSFGQPWKANFIKIYNPDPDYQIICSIPYFTSAYTFPFPLTSISSHFCYFPFLKNDQEVDKSETWMEKVGKLIADTKITLNGISKHPYWINIKKSTPVMFKCQVRGEIKVQLRILSTPKIFLFFLSY